MGASTAMPLAALPILKWKNFVLMLSVSLMALPGNIDFTDYINSYLIKMTRTDWHRHNIKLVQLLSNILYLISSEATL